MDAYHTHCGDNCGRWNCEIVFVTLTVFLRINEKTNMKTFDLIFAHVSMAISIFCTVYLLINKNYAGAVGFFMAFSANTTILRMIYKPYK